MKDKHIRVKSEADLYRSIQQRVLQDGLLHPSTAKAILISKFAFYFLSICGLYAALFWVENTWLFASCFVLCGILMILLTFNFGHDASHDAVFKSKRLNHLLFHFCFMLVGADGTAWKERHIHDHHHAPNVEEYDTDLQISTFIRLSPMGAWFPYHRFQYLYAPMLYPIYTLYWIFIKDVVVLFQQKRSWRSYFIFVSQKAIYLGYLLILPMLYAQQAWWMVLGSFLLMHLLQSIFLLFTFLITHHVEETTYPSLNAQGHINMSWMKNQVESSNDFYPFCHWANAIFGGFNNHTAHHLFPHVHHVHYPKMNRILYPMLEDNQLEPNQTSYFGGIRSHLRLLKKMGQHPIASSIIIS